MGEAGAGVVRGPGGGDFSGVDSFQYHREVLIVHFVD